MSTLNDYLKIGYVIIGSNALGEITGLSKNNCLYPDIKTVYVEDGSRIFVSDMNKTIILSQDAEQLFLKGKSENKPIFKNNINRIIRKVLKKSNFIKYLITND